MTSVKIKAHKLKDRRFNNWHSNVEGRWRIADLRADEAYCNDWISLDSLAWDAKRKQLYIGLTAINTDILHTFDPATGAFKSLGFQRVSNKFDVKLHRSIEQDTDGTLFLATALLHDIDEQHEAKGGKLLHYNPDSDQYTLLAEPIPYNYLQSILLDAENRIIYGFSYPAEQWFRYDIDSGKISTAYVGNGLMICQPHCAVLDTQRRLWGTWGESRAFENDPGPTPIRIFCYDPATDKFTWHEHGFSKVAPRDYGRVDHMLLGKDGFIYVGTTMGALCRLDPATADVTYLGKPFAGSRLAGLVQASDGLIYGAGNNGYDEDNNGTCRLCVCDPTSGVIRDLGALVDPETGAGASNIHMIVESDPGILYLGENDNLWRSSYLWECRINN
jgi:hypothetical protein